MKVFRNKKIAIISLAILILVVLVTAVLIFIFTKNQTNNQDTSEIQEYITRINNYKKESLEAAFAGNYDGAQKILDEAIKKESTNKAKSDIYLSKSTLAYNENKYNEAFDYAIKSYELDQTFAPADFAAQCAELSGKKDQSLKYYKIALGIVPEDTPDTLRYKNRISAKIQELETEQ